VGRPGFDRLGPIHRQHPAQERLTVEIPLRVEVEFETVAGLEDDRLANPVLTVHLAEHLAPLLGCEGDLLPNLHRAIMIRQIVQDQLHGYGTFPTMDKRYSLRESEKNIKP